MTQYSLVQLAEILKITRQRLANILEHHTVEGIVFRGNRYIIPTQSVSKVKEILGYSEDFNEDEYEELEAISEKLLEAAQFMPNRHYIVDKIKKYRIPTLSHLGKTYIHKEKSKYLIESIINERTTPGGFYPVKDISEKTGLSINTITRLAKENKITSLFKVINGTKVRLALLSDVKYIIKQINKTEAFSEELNEDYITINQAAEMIGYNNGLIHAMISDGFFKDVEKDLHGIKIHICEIQHFIKEGFSNITQITEKLGVWNNTIRKVLRENIIDGVFVLSRGMYLIPERAIPEIKRLCNYTDNFNADDHLNLSQIINEIHEKGFRKIYYTELLNYIKRYKIHSIKHLNNRYLSKEDAEKLIQKLTEERTIPVGFIVAREAAVKANISLDALLDWAKNGKVESADRIIDSTKQKVVKWSDVERHLNLDSSFPEDHETISIKEASKLLDISSHSVYGFIKKGKLKAWRGIYGYAVSLESINELLDARQAPSEPFSRDKAVSTLKHYIETLETPEDLNITKSLFIDFMTIKINAAQGRDRNIKVNAGNLKNMYKVILRKCSDQIYNEEQFKHLITDNTIPDYVKKLLVQFFNYSCKKKGVVLNKEYVFQEKYHKKNPLENDDCYTPKVYNLYETYVKDIEYHISKAISSRHHANMWVYTIMLLTDCWRPGDIICEMPNFDIEATGISSFDWFENNKLSEEQCALIITQLHLKIKFSDTGKTNADLILLVIPELEMPLSYALIISELHRRSIKEWEINQKKTLLGSFWTGDSDDTAKYLTSIRNAHLKFFEKYPLLGEEFSAKKLNSSTMTYLFFHLVENGDHDASIAVNFPQQARSHTDPSNTTPYIKLSNKDGPIDRVAVNLFKRGLFGWTYNFMVQYVTEGLCIAQSLEERSMTIDNLRNEMSLSELEQWAQLLSEIRDRKQTTVQRLMKLEKLELQQLIVRIYMGKMPSKDGYGQCLSYPECPFSQRSKCLGCHDFIPHFQILAEASNEFRRLIKSLTEANSEANLKRDSLFLINVLVILNEACTAFGKDKVNSYLPELERRASLQSISAKLRT